MEQSLKAKILQLATKEVIERVKDSSLAKTRGLINCHAEKAIENYQGKLEAAIAAFNYECENKTGLYDEAPEGSINPHQFENQK